MFVLESERMNSGGTGLNFDMGLLGYLGGGWEQAVGLYPQGIGCEGGGDGRCCPIKRLV